MGKLKQNFEKKAKVATEFDKKTPEQRVKSIKSGKVLKKKADLPKEVLKEAGAKLIKNDPEIKKKVKKLKDDSKPATSASDSIKKDLVEKGVVNLRTGISKELENNSNLAKNLFDDELRYGLNVVGMKIPKCPPHTRKILLKHSIYDDNPDVCFFITDSIPKKGDQDETVRKFKEKLEAAKITNVNNIMTLGQLKRDYTTHNLKLKLCHTYDIFLVESKISEHVYSILGKNFIRKRKRPFQVDTSNDAKMKISIDNAIRKSTMNISPKSLISSFEIGTAKMDNKKIVENIMSAAEQLKEKWIGGWKNVSRIYLRPMQPSKVSIPIYVSSIDPNDVDIPVIIGPKKQRMDKLSLKLKKKNDKVILDPNTKKISKVFEPKKSTDSTIVATKEDGKNKKRKNPVDKELEVPQKKKKEIEAKLADDKQMAEKAKVAKLDKKKKIKDVEPEETPAVETEGKKKKKKKNKQETAAIIEETALIKPDKKKKVSKDLPQSAVPDDDDVVVAKPKNKKKKTAALTEAINSEKSVAEVKETGAANSKKKKAKKNKT